MLVSARQGLNALAELKIQRRLTLQSIDDCENFLVSQIAQTASLQYASCETMIRQKLATELGYVITQRAEMVVLPPDAIRLQQPQSWLTLRTHLLDVIEVMEDVCQRIKVPMSGKEPRDSLKDKLQVLRGIVASCHEKMQTVRGILVEIHSVRLADQAEDCGLHQVLDQLKELEEIDNLNKFEVGEALRRVTQVNVERYLSTEHSVTPEMLAICKNVLFEYAEIRGRAGIQLCVDAAAL
ncbi:outer protein P, partial [Xanthomonas bromi]